MILTRQELTSFGKKEISEAVPFTKEDFKENPLIMDVKNINANVASEYIAGLTMIHIHLKGDMVLRSTRTLTPVDYPLDIEDDLILAYGEENFDPDSMILFEGNELDLNPLYYSLIISSLPLKVLADSDKDNYQGDHWEVLTEDEYNKRKKENPTDSPFAELEDLDLDD